MAEQEATMSSALADLKKVNEEKVRLTECIENLEESVDMITSQLDSS